MRAVADHITLILRTNWRRSSTAIWIKCPTCRRELRLAVHSIDKYGRVTPDIICMACSFTGELELADWPAGAKYVGADAPRP